MVRSALADESLLPYIQNLATEETCTIGLILGQPTSSKDYVFHFAKTPLIQNADKKEKAAEKVLPPKTLNHVSDNWVADHAKHATRMLPGGMYVLGIFVISDEDILVQFPQKLKSILNQMHKQLSANFYIFGNPNVAADKLVLNYSILKKNFTCKNYNATTSAVTSAEFKFQPKAMKWNQLECQYNLDQTFPIFEGRIDWATKKHLQAILESINESLKSAVYLYDNEIKDSDETLESIGKKKKIDKSKNLKKDKSESKAIEISIFTPCNENDSKDLEVKGCGGFVRITGQVSCKLWLCPRVSISVASEAVSQDIIRSLAARLEMHWDSLIDEESGSSEDINSVHEPPRRVLIALPSSKVMLSDYLFPGEGAYEALISLQELIDINIQDEKSIIDVEGQADLTDLYPPEENLPIDTEENSPIQLPADSNKFIYVTGFIVALIVLIISLFVHFIRG